MYKYSKSKINEKIFNYLSDDKLIDKDELFSLLQYAEKEEISKTELDSLISNTKKELSFTENEYNTEEVYREAISKLSSGQNLDGSFEFYIKEHAKDLGIGDKDADSIIRKIREISPNRKDKKHNNSKAKYFFGIAAMFVVGLSFAVYSYMTSNDTPTKGNYNQSSISDKSQQVETKSEKAANLAPSVNYSYVYRRNNTNLDINSMVNDLVYLDDAYRSRYIGFLVSLKNIINHTWHLDTPIDRYVSTIMYRYDETTLNKTNFEKLTIEYIKEEKLLILMHRIINAASRIPEVDVFSGKYLEKTQKIDWDDPDKSMIVLTEIFNKIKNDLRSGHISKSKQSASEILEIARMASIIPIVYYYQSMNGFVGSNSFTEYIPSQVLSSLIPDRYEVGLQEPNTISPLMKYEGFLQNVVDMREPNTDEVKDFKEWCDGVRDYEMLGLLSFLQSYAIHSDSWLTILDLDNFFSTPKPSILVTDYKPLVDKYFALEKFLAESEYLIEMIATSDSELDFIRLSIEPVKIMHQHLLLLSRVVFFDLPLASDSLQTLLRIKNAKGYFNDNERSMVEVGQVYSSLSPIILRFHVSPSVHEMWQVTMKTLKDELSKNEYKELEQRSKTQPDWLEPPKS